MNNEHFVRTLLKQGPSFMSLNSYVSSVIDRLKKRKVDTQVIEKNASTVIKDLFLKVSEDFKSFKVTEEFYQLANYFLTVKHDKNELPLVEFFNDRVIQNGQAMMTAYTDKLCTIYNQICGGYSENFNEMWLYSPISESIVEEEVKTSYNKFLLYWAEMWKTIGIVQDYKEIEVSNLLILDRYSFEEDPDTLPAQKLKDSADYLIQSNNEILVKCFDFKNRVYTDLDTLTDYDEYEWDTETYKSPVKVVVIKTINLSKYENGNLYKRLLPITTYVRMPFRQNFFKWALYMIKYKYENPELSLSQVLLKGLVHTDSYSATYSPVDFNGVVFTDLVVDKILSEKLEDLFLPMNGSPRRINFAV